MKYLIGILLLLAVVLSACSADTQNITENATGNDTGGVQVCTMDAKICEDGSAVGRNPGNNCEFYPCPDLAARNYVSTDVEECKLVQFMCIPEMRPFFDDTGCGCEPKDRERSYVNTNVTVCAASDWMCDRGQQQFFDDTGCGCEPMRNESFTNMTNPAASYCVDNGGISNIQTDENGSQTGYCTLPSGVVCEEWTYYRGECSSAKLKANECAEPRINSSEVACTMQYDPVCGWFNQNIQCIDYPCAATYGNSCEACADTKVDYWTQGECPSSNPSTLAAQCEGLGGTWVPEFYECEYVSAEACTELSGAYDECTSACRHNPEAEACTLQCVPVCSLAATY